MSMNHAVIFLSQRNNTTVKGSSTSIAMEGKTFIFVVLSGLVFLPDCFARIYVIVEKAKTWAEAQSYCRWKYTDLATVENKEELDKLVAAAQEHYNGQVWIGLYDDINSWRWSLKKEGYYGEGEAEFRMWNSGEPNNFGGYETCAEMTADGLWNDLPCTLTKQFVCYNGNVETVTSSSFFFVNEYKIWSEAQSYCREHYTDLASVRNQSENDKVKTMTQNQPIWLGLYRDSWKWSDGSPTSIRNWNYNEPNGNINTPCVCLHEGKWEDHECNKTLHFVCHIVPVKQQLVMVKITKNGSSVNLEDAAEALLQQFRQTLKDHAPSEDLKLTWRKQPDGKIFYLEEKEERKEKKEISYNLK
ncbi:macrophage mannose receptor 1-like [Siniperca chuatsi]|uniref:macrophage mannose receptor 1-like n=1 Tax=Siniperca chuatsi TaxID=119488 RepID=UPI001CE0F86F|nr:macrophage mannose receptor 1-like [Siniperca chuatsi]